MDAYRLPPRAQELVKCFVNFHERVTYFLEASEHNIESLEHIEWITHVCTPSYEDIETLVEDTASIYTSLSFIRLLYRDNKFEDIRDRNIRLVDALESQSPRLVLEELFKYLDKFTAEDRVRSFLLLASEVDEEGNKVRVEWLDKISQSFEVSLRALRPQLLLAASIIGHEPMVTRLLQDIAADEELMPNVDAVEAECLIEATVNKHFLIVKKLLDGGRFSNGSETRWDAIVQALRVSCTNGSADITDILLPHYLSYCSLTSACSAHHPRLLRLALSNWHFEIVEMLLDCDPRGPLCNMMELIVSLRGEVAQVVQERTEAPPPGFVAIVVGDGNDDVADLLLWDAAALARGVSSGNTTLVRFLVNHVSFCPETLRAALVTAQDNGNHEVVEVISTRLQQMTGQHARIADNEVGSEAVDELMVSSSSVNLNCSDRVFLTTQTRIDKLSQPELINQYFPNGMNDSQRDLTDAHNDNDVVAERSPYLIRSQSTENLEALRTTCRSTVERVISSAKQSVLKMNEICQDEFVQVSTDDKIEEDNETEVAVDSLADLQHPKEIYPDATQAWLREFSSKVVDQIICEGKSAVTQNKVEMSTIATPTDNTKAVIQDSTMVNSSEESATVDCDQPTVETGSPSIELTPDGYSPVCEQSAATDQNEDEDGTQTVIDKFDVLDVVTGDSLANSNDKATTSELPVMQAGNFADAITSPSSDELNSNCCDPAVDNSTSDAEASKNDTSAKLRNDEASVILETLLQNVALQQERPGTEVNTIATKEDRDEGAPRSSHVSDPEIGITTEPHKGIYSVKAAVVHPRNSASTIRYPAASPNRATIICPVKWVEHTMDASETSGPAIDISAPLSEGDRVEVRYKGRHISLPGVITFCHSNDAYDIVYEDGEEDICVPREFIQLMNCHDLRKCNEDNPEQRQESGKHHFSNENLLTNNGCSLANVEREDDDGSNFTSAPCTSPAPQALWSDDAEKSNDMRLCTNEEPGARKILLDQLSGTTRSAPSLILPDYEERSAHNAPKVEVPSSIPADLQNTANSSNSSRVSPNSSSEKLSLQQSAPEQPLVDNAVTIEHLPEIPSVFVPNTEFEGSATNDTVAEIRFTIGTSQRSLRDRQSSVASQQSRCRTADNVSAEEMAEWKNVDLLLNRKRRFFQTQTGSIESTKVPWGEEFVTIQSLKRFAAQYPDILRAHIETQLRELDGPLLGSSPGKPRSPKKTNASAHSGASQARESLLLMKDLAFLLKHRLAPFFDTIIPVVLETVFSAEKRFLCETATEVLDAIILHCSGRKLALVFLQLNETYSKYEDLRLYNLASVYVEKCVHNWSKPECSSLLHSSPSSTTLLTLLAALLISKSVPGRIAAQKSFKYLRDELGNRNFEVVLRAHVPKTLQKIVIKECGGVLNPSRTRSSSRQSEGEKQVDTRSPTIVQTSPSILQRMLLHRQNRVLPKQT